MANSKTTNNVVSYLVGISVAAVAVGGMILTLHLNSDAYAAQVLDDEISAMQVDELRTIVLPVRNGLVPPNGPKKSKLLGALLTLGDAHTDLKLRVDALAVSQEHAHNEIGAAAQSSLLKLGDAVIAPLREMLQNDDPETYSRACTAINLLGRDAQTLLPELTDRVRSEDELVSALAYFALENMGDLALPILPDMEEVLLGREFHTQIYICKICIGLGRDAAPMAELLAKLHASGNVSSRSWAGVALGAIGPVENVDTLQLLTSRMNAFTQIDKERAFVGLALMGAEAESATEEIKAVMLDPNSRVRPHAAYAYYKITDDKDTASQTLAALLPNRNERQMALLQLEKMGADGAGAISAIEPFLKSSSVADREAAVLTLGSFGVKAASSKTAIEPLLHDPDPLLRQAAQEALDAIDGKRSNLDDEQPSP